LTLKSILCNPDSLKKSLCYARGPHHPRGEKVVKRHVHYKPTKEESQKITEDVQLLHDKEHLQEHLEDVIPEPNFSKMTDEEVEFYYFQVHDTDKNSKLDGLEILQAMSHTSQHAYDENGNEVPTETNAEDFDLYIELIDQVLEEDDADHDGYLSYSEYASGRRRTKKKREEHNVPVVQMIP
ncbi:multiple coagulation factor deficiency protein 2 homolog, partial [Anoplophora glabripennis]|uniref:multiple coagulation factor deficiency protein 2 homolog n=1 Tax=Anoplophora glabripennis TaxID=217634 RepID=UPI0008743439